ncbi:hypothetical protein GUITHDRAFT_108937 [Guillardia theta CCMP2712]|uniref:Uncharacterized protein n=1 Tax=Guillardia theta (strain CCMP2712) TaxID=905079 RepID=L1J9T9_GUITC|nr:hypothetical protein GUITHDRAFT_108937 [Guillardia theta CCMP2712]EKX45298.1 hypothetical protein GUITHDRAFT_108937 [Guillardia theta CCMP2712]|eukprot:XP_005832278.1 hypothetical protein GUITHDRAFT_108937 [Guillardia theta CCMP2712]
MAESYLCCTDPPEAQQKMRIVHQKNVRGSLKPILYSPEQGFQRGGRVSPRHDQDNISRKNIRFKDPPEHQAAQRSFNVVVNHNEQRENKTSESKPASDKAPDVMLEAFRRFPSYHKGKVTLQDIEQNLRKVLPDARNLECLKASIAQARKQSEIDQVDIETFRKSFETHFKAREQPTISSGDRFQHQSYKHPMTLPKNRLY